MKSQVAQTRNKTFIVLSEVSVRCKPVCFSVSASYNSASYNSASYNHMYFDGDTSLCGVITGNLESDAPNTPPRLPDLLAQKIIQ